MSMVRGSQLYASTVKGVVIGLGQRKMVLASRLVTWGGCSMSE